TAILGENLDTGGEDSRNGAGKSAIMDALCYVLFGSVIRDVTNQKLINKFVSKKLPMLVWVEFTKGDKAYRIERGERPSVLRLFQKPIDSEEPFNTKEDRKFKFEITENKNET